jgi:hypothetical protein
VAQVGPGVQHSIARLGVHVALMSYIGKNISIETIKNRLHG